MSETYANQFIGRHLYLRSLRTRVVLSQLPFFLTMTLALALIVILNPALLTDVSLVVGWSLNALLFLACFIVPWKKLHPAAQLVIPYLDLVAMALFREGAQSLLASSAILALFPIFWLCASGFAPKTAIVVSTLSTWLVVWSTVFQSGETLSVQLLVKPLLFPFMVLVFSIAVVILTSSIEAQRSALLTKDHQLRTSLSESQHRERLMTTIVDTVGVGVVVVDADGHDRLMNSTQRSIHALGIPAGQSDAEEKELLLFTPEKKWLAAEDRPVSRAIKGETFTNYQIWIGSGPRARALSVTARSILCDDESFDGAVIAFHDVTDMVNALSAKDDFVANISHEFRTPLTAIQSYLALAMETPDLGPRVVEKYLTIADRNAERLNGLVTDLISSGTVTLNRAPTDVVQLVRHSLASAAPACLANSVVVDWSHQQPVMASIDGIRISQVLDNLISNAVKYSPDGGTLSVRVWPDGRDLHCEVTDTGLGMSAADQSRIFQKFFRAGNAVDRKIPGIGLGLRISKDIIDNHGGTLTFESRDGEGTTMRFIIPDCVITSGTSSASV